jgi:hypothetical protein
MLHNNVSVVTLLCFKCYMLKALCLVLVISDNAQVLIMCLRLYVAKDD